MKIFFHSPSGLFPKWMREREYLMVDSRCFTALILGRVLCVYVKVKIIFIPYLRRIMHVPPSLYPVIYWSEVLVIKFCQLT